MKMKSKKVLVLCLAAALFVGTCIGASAANTLETISAYLNYGITVEYNGEVQTLRDANGTQVYPITYNGSTYLPIRAISNMLGIPVNWNNSAYAVELGTSENGVDLIDTYTPYSYRTSYYEHVQSSDNKTTSVAGTTISHWISMHYSGIEGYGYYNIGGTYSSLTFKTYSNYDETLNFYGDNDVLIASIDVSANQMPTTHTIDLSNATQLQITQVDKSITHQETNKIVYIFDAVLK